MSNPPANSDSLELSHLGLRFASQETERTYCAWRNEQNLPVIRLAGAVSIPAWVVIPFPAYLWRPDINWMAVWWLDYALVIPVIAAMMIASYTSVRRYATPLSGLTLCLAGSTALWVITVKVPPLTGIEMTGPAIAAMLVMASFALFMRLPPVTAVVATAPFMMTEIAVTIHEGRAGILPAVHAWGYLNSLGLAYFFIGVMSIVGERFFRRAFVSEHTVARQNMALERSRGLIRRYVPPALADQIIAGELEGIEAPQRRRVTVLFSDIAGFTDIADRVEPEVMTQIISEYMATMAEVVDTHNGTLNEFVGDGLMALFGAPRMLDPEEQARSAVRAAQAMQAALPDLNARWRKLGLGAPLQIRIGINTGMVSVGSYGSEGRMTYTAIGLQTNIAARIQTHCEPGGILLSDATWQLIRDEIECAPKGEVQCKGVHFPIAVYSPVIL